MAEPEADRGEVDEAKEALGGLVVARGDAAGSSAAGEQPKFSTYAQTAQGAAHVIVKFSETLDSPVSQRWRDLLLAELASHCPQLTPIHSGAGLQCAVLLPAGGETRWTNPANARGIGLRPLGQFYLGEPNLEGWLLGFGALDNQTLRQLCRQLGNLMQSS